MFELILFRPDVTAEWEHFESQMKLLSPALCLLFSNSGMILSYCYLQLKIFRLINFALCGLFKRKVSYLKIELLSATFFFPTTFLAIINLGVAESQKNIFEMFTQSIRGARRPQLVSDNGIMRDKSNQL